MDGDQNNLSTDKVENLIGFPYKDYNEFEKNWKTGNITMGIDFGLAREWAMSGGLYSPVFLATLLNILNLIIFITAAGFIIYIVLIKSYLWLLTLPLLIIGFFLSHPVMSRNLGCLSSGYFLLGGAGFIWAVCKNIHGLLALTVCLLIIWLCIKIIYSLSLRALLDATATHEDLLCKLWNTGQLLIQLNNGDSVSLPLEERLKRR